MNSSGTTRAAVSRLFEGNSSPDSPRVGLELELFVVDRSGALAPPHAVAALVRGLDHVTFEPGGQLELNPPPAFGPVAAVRLLSKLQDQVAGRLKVAGYSLAAAGVEPSVAPMNRPLYLQDPRYLAMQAHFESVGPAGAWFMGRTAGTHINVDLLPGPGGREQWITANRLAPLLAALFANSRFVDRWPSMEGTARLRIWREIDPPRTAHGELGLVDNHVREYERFALGAPVIGSSFAGDRGFEQHLTTLFPPVRPRGRYLEIRAIDSIDIDRVRVAACLTTILLTLRSARRDLNGVLCSHHPRDLWDRCADRGLGDALVRDLTDQMIGIACDAIGRPGGSFVPEGCGRRSRLCAGTSPSVLVSQLPASRRRVRFPDDRSSPAPPVAKGPASSSPWGSRRLC